MIRFECRKVTLEILIKMGGRKVSLEARRPQWEGGAVGILVRRGRGSNDGVDITYLKDVKKARKAGSVTD